MKTFEVKGKKFQAGYYTQEVFRDKNGNDVATYWCVFSKESAKANPNKLSTCNLMLEYFEVLPSNAEIFNQTN